MSLLLATDYQKLSERAIVYEELEAQRFILIRDIALNPEIYTTDKCDVLVIIPQNYPQEGNDMFWTYPRLVRKNNVALPATSNPGDGDNRLVNSTEYCRWSRHWPAGTSFAWRPGRDDINTIYRRVEGALEKPDT